MNQTRWILCVVFGVLHNRDMKMAYLHVIYNQRHSTSILLISVLYLLCYAEENIRKVNTCVEYDTVLPCENHIKNADMAVEWTRPDQTRHIYVYYQKNGDEKKDIDPSYRNRTSLFKEELTKGNVSLRIKNVTSSDEGIYKCQIEESQKKCIVQLIVGNCQLVSASLGEYAVLPCEDRTIETTNMAVEWTRQDLQNDDQYVYIYKNGEEEEHSNNSYSNRTSLFSEELIKGNLSLNISRVNSSDEGTYTCKIWNSVNSVLLKECTVLLLIVVPTSVQSTEEHRRNEEMDGIFLSLKISIPLIVFISVLVYKRQSILKLVHSRPADGDEQSPGNGDSEGSSLPHQNRPDSAAGGAGTPLLPATC